MERFRIVNNYFDNGYRTWCGYRCPKCGNIADGDETSNPDVLFRCPNCGFESDKPALDPEEKFYKLAKTWQAFIGLPSGIEPSAKAVRGFLESCEEVEFAGPKGDVLARAYWREHDYEGNAIGGCISIPHKRIK